MTTSSGVTITKTKTADRKWIAGSETDDIFDDVFQVTSSAPVSSTSEKSYSYTVEEPLVISASCDVIQSGIITLTTSGNNEPVTIDFGNSGCDRKVYVSEGTQIVNQEMTLAQWKFKFCRLILSDEISHE